MTDGTDRTSTPQPDPAAGQGGYGYPQGTPGGYGFPQVWQPNPYQQPQPQPQSLPGTDAEPPQHPQAPGAQQPPLESQPQPQPQSTGFTPPPQPDWQAMADRSESQRRTRKRIWMAAIGLAACGLGVGAGLFILERTGKEGNAPGPGASRSATAAPGQDTNSPTVPGEPNLLRDRSGQVNIALSPDAVLGKVDNGNVLRLRSNGNSYAQAAEQVVDASKDFTVSAWVYNEAEGGSRFAISQGDGTSYSFELGREDSNGKKSWVFRMQTDEKGAASTAVAAASEGLNTVRTWALLTGVYDAQAKTLTLYVDGKEAGRAPVAAAWSGQGPLQLGRSRHHGIWSGPWAGVIGHVLVWDKPLSADQVLALKGGKLDKEIKPVGSWLVG
ncbi:LamG domain-containing protein [Streptomyces sp. Sge12]|uniref:LamG domain-containing protein n=1 Tax=Streptomyces sp. Sge12 TaxID=1972846 RepID=UPI001331B6FB|nr:LamG domain-containing protein [Streptomyces sp. Sge12]